MDTLEIYNKEQHRQRFEKLLFDSEGEIAYSYLKSRNISDDLIRDLKLGWCPLDDEYYSLRGRITVPLNDISGKTLAFAGRVPTTKDVNGNNISLYHYGISELNWWHEGFPFLNKSNYLYGIEHAYRSIYSKGFAFIVEGEFDLWTLKEHGIHNAVCVLGSSLTIYQVGILRRFCDKIIVLFDGDVAGRKGWEFIKENYFEKIDMNFFQMCLPEKEDPCSFVSKYGVGPLQTSMKELLEND